MIEYCSADSIEKYIRLRPSFSFDNENLAKMVNYFVEGSTTVIGNKMVEEFLDLTYTVARGCRCMSCYEWQLIDSDGTVHYHGESMGELMNNIIKESV